MRLKSFFIESRIEKNHNYLRFCLGPFRFRLICVYNLFGDGRVVMLLLNTNSLLLEAVENPEGDTYAILSHTWAAGEVMFH